MSVIGVVAEYNPFHLGHSYHIARSRELVGEGAVVCVMSGDFVQRGEAACFDKFTRAEAACRCGADLVVELPLPWCLSSAEGFARGAVALLDALGCTHLSFGSEAGELSPLQALAEMLAEPAFNEQVKQIMAETPAMSYAVARQAAASLRLGEVSELLAKPNNILAVEYLKALRRLSSPLQPVTVARFGSEHDGEGGAGKAAKELRQRLREGRSIEPFVPAEAHAVYRDRERPDEALLEAALLSRLRMLAAEDFERLPDAGEGLGRRLFRAAQNEPDLSSILAAAKSKRYAMARLRRLLCCASLGVTAGMAEGVPPYARVLAANARGRALLHGLRASALPILTKPAEVRAIGGRAEEIFSLGAAAHDLYALAYPSPENRRGGEDWRRGPAIL